ncbi:DUF4350 domain-containing protein [Bacillus infantis]|uniref:DUF4350 domain-containing protein n=1 Tax=Bacillus infantis TaxID=324767 RepID=UPI001CD40A2D|nr:DUF4350 domain-containing protein [Bacillus infantis]MCA1038312.1 DUF4350 domain-containing protein [Bacillus infantis]
MRTQLIKKAFYWIVPLLLFIMASYFLAGDAPAGYPPYLSKSPSPTGIKGLYTYLEQNGSSIRKWSRDPGLLPNPEEPILLVMAEPSSVPDREEMAAYTRFLENGHTILLFKENPAPMFGIETEQFASEAESAVMVADKEGGKHSAAVFSPFRITEEPEDEILLSDELGAVAVKRAIGKGSLIAVNSPSWLTNGMILDENHFELILALMDVAAARDIFIDEFLHGQESSSGVGAYPQWFLVILIQGALLALLWIFYKGKRFGPVDWPREETVRFTDEKIAALSAWHIRGRRYQDSLRIQADYTKELLQEKWGIPYSRGWEEAGESILAKASSLTEKEVDSLTEGISSILKEENLHKKDYLRWSAKLDDLRKEVEKN